jgi:hypothetical protein
MYPADHVWSTRALERSLFHGVPDSPELMFNNGGNRHADDRSTRTALVAHGAPCGENAPCTDEQAEYYLDETDNLIKVRVRNRPQ